MFRKFVSQITENRLEFQDLPDVQVELQGRVGQRARIKDGVALLAVDRPRPLARFRIFQSPDEPATAEVQNLKTNYLVKGLKTRFSYKYVRLTTEKS